jgi:hypothetical protein
MKPEPRSGQRSPRCWTPPSPVTAGILLVGGATTMVISQTTGDDKLTPQETHERIVVNKMFSPTDFQKAQ